MTIIISPNGQKNNEFATWDIANKYRAGDLVVKTGSIYEANDDIPASTAWAIGTTGATWAETVTGGGGGGGTSLPTDAPGYLRNDGTGTLSWNTATVSAGSPAYSDVWILSTKTDPFWTEYTLTGDVPMMFDWQGTSNITLTGSALYGKQLSSGDKILVVNDAPVHTNSNYAMIVEFPSTPAVGDTFQIPFAAQGILVNAGSFVVGDTYTINQPGSTNFIAIGAADNSVGTTFVATGAGSGDGTAYASTGVLRCIFVPSAGQRGFVSAQGGSNGSIEFGQGTTNIGVFNSVTSQMGSQPITWTYAGVVDSIPTWYQLFF